MASDAGPVVVAFDGSPEAMAALRAAATLLAGHPLLVVAIWEPGLAMMVTSYPDATGFSYASVDPGDVAEVDRLQEQHATSAAEAGAQLAREMGAAAEALPVPDSVDVGETIAAIAEQRDAAAIVVGSHGMGRVKARLLGSTSQRVLRETRRPVLVVRAAD